MFRSLILLCCICLSIGWTPQAAVAAVGPDCAWYDYQVDAQADFERSPATSERLDEDDNGIACDGLPSKPTVLDGTERVRGNFLTDPHNPTIRGAGYSDHYEVRLPLVQFLPSSGGSSPCSMLASSESLHDLFEGVGVARTFYVYPLGGETPPPEEGSQVAKFDGLVWTVLDDPQVPVLLNVWLIEQGLAYFTVLPFQDDALSKEMAAAEESAKAANRGVWGDCAAPEIPAPGSHYTTPEPTANSVVVQNSSGDQIVPFTISTGGTYQLTVDISGGQVVFVAADAYYSDGTWLPQMSITSAEPGQYSSAGYLDPGSYYIQIKAVGPWKVTLTPLSP